jgi:hypothetical protein
MAKQNEGRRLALRLQLDLWSVASLVDWLVVCLVDWSVAWLVAWLLACLIG